MGLHVQIYRAAHGLDCTRDGVSSKVECLTLVNVPGPFEPTDSAPAAFLIIGNVPGSCKILIGDGSADFGQGMFGGNFAYSCDSRFSKAVQALTGSKVGYPVAIHDRYE